MLIEEKIIKLLGQREISGFFNLVEKNNIELDEYFKIYPNEKHVNDQQEEVYAGLDMRALSTSYLDYYQILNNLAQNKLLVDLGAGYCRGTFLALAINRQCISVEIDEYRISFAKKVHSDHVIKLDLKTNPIPRGDGYFLYLPWGSITNSILRSIYERNETCLLYIIESHGDFIQNLNLYKEFNLEDTLCASSKRHDDKIYIYRFNPSDFYRSIEAEDFKEENKIHYWLIKFENKIQTLEIESKAIDGKVINWSVDPKNSYACVYNNQTSIYFPERSRYIQYQFDSINKVIW